MKQQSITPEFAAMMAGIGMPIATALEVTTKAGDWDESKHPRADNGQFGEGGGGGKDPAHGGYRAQQEARIAENQQGARAMRRARLAQTQTPADRGAAAAKRDNQTARDQRARDNAEAARIAEEQHPDRSPAASSSYGQSTRAERNARATSEFRNLEAGAKVAAAQDAARGKPSGQTNQRRVSYANSKPTISKAGNKLYPAFNSAGKPTRVTIPED